MSLACASSGFGVKEECSIDMGSCLIHRSCWCFAPVLVQSSNAVTNYFGLYIFSNARRFAERSVPLNATPVLYIYLPRVRGRDVEVLGFIGFYVNSVGSVR